jgi:putative Mg2+ transporter-C (MgtC) family protein
MINWPAQLAILAEVFLAMVLGGIIGIERTTANKPAGFRTHMLVAGAAALLVGLSDALIHRFSPGAYTELIESDPIRVIQAIIAGISFLGAGTIFRHPKKQHVEGLTTAASLLFSGAIGICVALRQFVLAVAVTVLTLIVLRGVELIERRINKTTDER